MKKLIVLTLIIAVCSTSCRHLFGKRVNGSGKITTEIRNITGYNSINVSGDIDVYLKQDSTQSVKVVTDDNLQEYITTDEDGGVLNISIKRGYNPRPTDALKVYVSATEFRKLEASGDCDYFSEGQVGSKESMSIRLSGSCDAQLDLKSPKISAHVTGAGMVDLRGETRDLDLSGTGSSTFKCLDMMAENVEVDITGAGHADVFASVKLDISVAGAGTVRYKGNATVNQKVSGAGSVKKVE